MKEAEVEKDWEGEGHEDPIEQPQEEDHLSEEALLEVDDKLVQEVEPIPEQTARLNVGWKPWNHSSDFKVQTKCQKRNENKRNVLYLPSQISRFVKNWNKAK